jgi:hypothetical protein
VQKASSSQFGIVEVDGTTITAVGGVISAVLGGGSSNLATEYTTTTPTAPTTGLTIFARKRPGHTRLAQIGIRGLDTELQEFFPSAEIMYLVATVNSAIPQSYGCAAATTNGPAAKTQTTTSQFTTYRRMALNNPSGTNQFSQCRTPTAVLFRGSSSVIGGFYAVVRFGVESNLANSRIMAGVNGNWAGNNDVSNSTDCFVFGKDSADSNLQVMYNDNAGTCTKVDLGASFPATTSAADMYEGRLYCPPNGSTMYYWIKNLMSGAEASGDTGVSTNIPTTTTAMNLGVWFGTGSTRRPRKPQAVLRHRWRQSFANSRRNSYSRRSCNC